jgi:hypothetical protein
MFDANDDLDEQYQNLTDKQRAVIDAHAENPDETNRKKTELAEDKLGDSINESYASQVINKKYPKLAKYREDIEQNQRQEGSMTTEGDPFSGELSEDKGFQTFDERPVKETQSQDQEPTQETPQPAVAQQPVQVREDVDGVLLKIDYRYLRELLVDQETKLPDALQARLVDVLVERARAGGAVES